MRSYVTWREYAKAFLSHVLSTFSRSECDVYLIESPQVIRHESESNFIEYQLPCLGDLYGIAERRSGYVELDKLTFSSFYSQLYAHTSVCEIAVVWKTELFLFGWTEWIYIELQKMC